MILFSFNILTKRIKINQTSGLKSIESKLDSPIDWFDLGSTLFLFLASVVHFYIALCQMNQTI